MAKKRVFEAAFTEKELPAPLDPTILEALVVRLRTGDLSVKNEIIGGHMRLGMSATAKYSRRYPFLRDDLIGASMFGICQAVDWAATKLYDNNITPYIYRTCDRFIRDMVEARNPIRIPRRTFLALTDDGDMFVPLVQAITHIDDDGNYYDEYDKLSEVSGTIEEHPMLFAEMLESLLLSARDRTLIDMLLEDWTQTEIAEHLGVSKMYITQMKQQIGERIRHYQKRIENARPKTVRRKSDVDTRTTLRRRAAC